MAMNAATFSLKHVAPRPRFLEATGPRPPVSGAVLALYCLKFVTALGLTALVLPFV